MARNPPVSTLPDPEFDPPPRNRLAPTADVVRFYQRLVVNPFLGAIGLLTGMAIWLSLESTLSDLSRFPLFAFSWVSCYFLFQYHCLDCAETGWFHRRHLHACSRVRERWSEGRMCFVDLRLQAVIWLLVILVVCEITSAFIHQ